MLAACLRKQPEARVSTETVLRSWGTGVIAHCAPPGDPCEPLAVLSKDLDRKQGGEVLLLLKLGKRNMFCSVSWWKGSQWPRGSESLSFCTLHSDIRTRPAYQNLAWFYARRTENSTLWLVLGADCAVYVSQISVIDRSCPFTTPLCHTLITCLNRIHAALTWSPRNGSVLSLMTADHWSFLWWIWHTNALRVLNFRSHGPAFSVGYGRFLHWLWRKAPTSIPGFHERNGSQGWPVWAFCCSVGTDTEKV